MTSTSFAVHNGTVENGGSSFRYRKKWLVRWSIHGLSLIGLLGIGHHYYHVTTSPSLRSLSSSSNEGVIDPLYLRAHQESLGFFRNVPEDVWEHRKSITLNRIHGPTNENLMDPNHVYSQQRQRYYKTSPNAYYQNYWDPDFVCFQEEKVGNVGDGHKWICDPHALPTQDCLVYSIGSFGDFSFEEALQKIAPQCEIHVFDPGHYREKMKEFQLKATYHGWGIQGTQEFPKSNSAFMKQQLDAKRNKSLHLMTLLETMKVLGHEGRRIDVLKMDCEGCEWTSYHDFLQVDIRQILIEVHEYIPPNTNQFFDALHDAGYVIFHKEPNIEYGGGRCVEYGFLKLSKSFFEKESTKKGVANSPNNNMATGKATTTAAVATPGTSTIPAMPKTAAGTASAASGNYGVAAATTTLANHMTHNIMATTPRTAAVAAVTPGTAVMGTGVAATPRTAAATATPGIAATATPGTVAISAMSETTATTTAMGTGATIATTTAKETTTQVRKA